MLRFHVNLPGCIYIEGPFVVTQKSFCGCRSFLDGNILLMEEILHLLIGSLSHYFKGFLTSQVVGAEFLLSTITERCLKRCYSTICVHEFRLLPKLTLIPLGQCQLLQQISAYLHQTFAAKITDVDPHHLRESYILVIHDHSW